MAEFSETSRTTQLINQITMTIQNFTQKTEELISYADSIKKENPKRARKLLESQLDEIIKLISRINNSNLN